MAHLYRATNTVNGKTYIGVAKNPRRRFNQHRSDARKGSELLLHRAIRKYGQEAISFRVIAKLPTVEEAYIAERIQIALEAPEYNLTAGGVGVLGLKRKPLSAETREKIAEKLRGRHPSPEVRARLGGGRRGRKFGPLSPETRAKISAAKKGQPGPRLGCSPSPETRAKISRSLSGRIRPDLRRPSGKASKSQVTGISKPTQVRKHPLDRLLDEMKSNSPKTPRRLPCRG